jgi:hypothetical protein
MIAELPKTCIGSSTPDLSVAQVRSLKTCASRTAVLLTGVPELTAPLIETGIAGLQSPIVRPFR